MRQHLFIIVCSGLMIACSTIRKQSVTHLPVWMTGTFTDDYGIKYAINDTLFWQQPSAKYHIINWNKEEQYLLVKNDENNSSEKNLYSRIDYMEFKNIKPYTWGFCLTVYDAKDTITAMKIPAANRDIPKKGCNGYPFSRMKHQ